MIRSPKETFSTGTLAHPFKAIAESEAFHIACDYALLELVQSLPDAANPATGWDAHCQVAGARKVLDILKELHQPPAKRDRKLPTLNYHT